MEKANRSRIFVAALGFSLTWIFLQPSTLPWPEQLGEGGFSDTWYGILLGAFIALSIVVIAGRRYVERFIEGHRVILFVLMMLSLAGFALLQSAGSFGSAELIACCAASLLAVGYLAIIMAWICGIATLGGAEAGLVVVLSVVLHVLIRSVFIAMGDVLFAIDSFGPAVSGVLWLVFRALGDGDPDRLEVDSVESGRSIEYDIGVFRDPAFAMVGAYVLCIICGRITMGVYFNTLGHPSADTLLVRNALVGLLGLLYLFVWRRRPNDERLSLVAWIPPTVMLLFGQIAILALGAEQSPLSSAAITGALMCLEAISLIMLFRLAYRKRASAVLVVGSGFLVARLIPLGIQRSLALQLISFFTVPSSSLVFVVITAVMVIIIGVFVVVFRFAITSGSDVRAFAQKDAVGRSGEPARPSREEIVLSIGRGAGLTPREIEIMGLVIEGNSQKRISEKLTLSYGTVQWYMKAIYKKLDIHSKQDLVDLVQERLG